MVDEIVKVERVDLASIKPLKPHPHMLEKQAQLLLVVPADQVASRPAPRLLAFNIPDADAVAHVRNVPRRGSALLRAEDLCALATGFAPRQEWVVSRPDSPPSLVAASWTGDRPLRQSYQTDP